MHQNLEVYDSTRASLEKCMAILKPSRYRCLKTATHLAGSTDDSVAAGGTQNRRRRPVALKAVAGEQDCMHVYALAELFVSRVQLSLPNDAVRLRKETRQREPPSARIALIARDLGVIKPLVTPEHLLWYLACRMEKELSEPQTLLNLNQMW